MVLSHSQSWQRVNHRPTDVDIIRYHNALSLLFIAFDLFSRQQVECFLPIMPVTDDFSRTLVPVIVRCPIDSIDVEDNYSQARRLSK